MENKIIQVIAANLACRPSEVTPDKNIIEDLGADSLDVVELVMAIEEEFDIDIPDEEIEKVQTVQQAIDYIVEAAG